MFSPLPWTGIIQEKTSNKDRSCIFEKLNFLTLVKPGFPFIVASRRWVLSGTTVMALQLHSFQRKEIFISSWN